MGLRIMEPCDDPTGATCTVFDNPEEIHIVEPRWYPSGVRLYDGSFVSLLPGLLLASFRLLRPLSDGHWRLPRPDGLLQR